MSARSSWFHRKPNHSVWVATTRSTPIHLGADTTPSSGLGNPTNAGNTARSSLGPARGPGASVKPPGAGPELSGEPWVPWGPARGEGGFPGRGSAACSALVLGNYILSKGAGGRGNKIPDWRPAEYHKKLDELKNCIYGSTKCREIESFVSP